MVEAAITAMKAATIRKLFTLTSHSELAPASHLGISCALDWQLLAIFARD